jgi:hypothetical protein
MWQRIQTVFLFFTALAMIMMFFFPSWEKIAADGTEFHQLTAFTYTYTNSVSTVPYEIFWPYAIAGILAGIAAGIALFEITSYKNRLTQMKLGALNSLVMSVVLGLTVWFSIELDQEVMPTFKGSYDIGLFMPAVAMIFNVLANRFIRKDEKLVRSVDRIR